MWYMIYDMWYVIYFNYILYVICAMCYMICDIWYVIGDTWYMICDIWYILIIYSMWYVLCAIWFVIYDMWYVICDIWYMMYDICILRTVSPLSRVWSISCKVNWHPTGRAANPQSLRRRLRSRLGMFTRQWRSLEATLRWAHRIHTCS